MSSSSPFNDYETTLGGTDCYLAGLPGYPRNFSRDTLIAGIIATNKQLIENQIVMSTLHQGRQYDCITGEEPGKIHHEFPGVVVNAPYVSTYNACDTTAFYLIGLEFLQRLNDAKYLDVNKKYASGIELALDYLKEHITDDIFWEYPPEGASHFSLKTTYWKDSIVPSITGKKEPNYPVAYALVQFQVARGLLAASRLLGRADLEKSADRMFRKGIAMFVSENEFCIEQDQIGRLEMSCSDELHVLAYIPTTYRDLLPIDEIATRAQRLVTPFGIACIPLEISEHLVDSYHGYVVWVFEQALINYGANKFGLKQIAKIASQCKGHIEEGNELLSVLPSVKSIGNDRQLWSVAAKIYFSDAQSLRLTDWL